MIFYFSRCLKQIQKDKAFWLLGGQDPGEPREPREAERRSERSLDSLSTVQSFEIPDEGSEEEERRQRVELFMKQLFFFGGVFRYSNLM